MSSVTEGARPKSPSGRDRILAAARDTFAERGYDGAAVGEIAARAGCAKSAIYYHFGSKAAVYDALLAADSEELLDRVRSAMPSPGGDVRHATRAVVDAYLSFIEDRPDAWRLLVRDAPVDPQLAALHAQRQRQRARALVGLFPPIPPTDVAKRTYVELLAVSLRAFATWWHEHPHVPRSLVVDAVMDFAAAGSERLGVGRADDDADQAMP